jgi:hypothetical protein
MKKISKGKHRAWHQLFNKRSWEMRMIFFLSFLIPLGKEQERKKVFGVKTSYFVTGGDSPASR